MRPITKRGAQGAPSREARPRAGREPARHIARLRIRRASSERSSGASVFAHRPVSRQEQALNAAHHARDPHLRGARLPREHRSEGPRRAQRSERDGRSPAAPPPGEHPHNDPVNNGNAEKTEGIPPVRKVCLPHRLSRGHAGRVSRRAIFDAERVPKRWVGSSCEIAEV